MNRRKSVVLAVLAAAVAAPTAWAAAIKWLTIPLGSYAFGHLAAPSAVVARADADAVGFECGKPSACSNEQPPRGEGCGCIDVLPQGPTSLDVARDGAVWLFDGVRHRLLAWQHGRLVRTVVLPPDVRDSDFVVGRTGTIYAFGGNVPHRPYLRLYALSSSGRVRWRAPTTVASSQARLLLAWDGSVYAVGPSASPTWTPLTKPTGRPLPLAAQRRRSSKLQPLDGRLRLLTTQPSPHELHFALVDRARTVVRAWRVTSRTSVGVARVAGTLLGDDLVVGVEVSQQVGKTFRWETVVLRLGATGRAERRLALDARAVWDPDGTTARTALRIGPDRRLYQLRTDPKIGVRIARYSLGSGARP